MPSHTFTRVGLWQESIDTNLASAQAAHREGSSVEELHALDYQAYAYLQTGQDRAVARIMTGLDALAAKVPDARPDAAPIPAGYYALAAIPARYALERGDWKAAAALSVRSTSFPWTSAITHFARALGAARSGQPAAARADIARLAELQKALADKKEQYWAQQVEIQMRGAEAWALSAEGRHDEAIAAMRAAADLEDTTEKAAVTPGPLAPARELLAEMLLEQGRAADALVEFEQAGKKEPNRFRGLAGSAAAAQRAGDRAKAAAYAKQLVALCAKADRPERPGLRKARELAKTSE
jgi:tetratricopeptide (TPR) repeat protein